MKGRATGSGSGRRSTLFASTIYSTVGDGDLAAANNSANKLARSAKSESMPLKIGTSSSDHDYAPDAAKSRVEKISPKVVTFAGFSAQSDNSNSLATCNGVNGKLSNGNGNGDANLTSDCDSSPSSQLHSPHPIAQQHY